MSQTLVAPKKPTTDKPQSLVNHLEELRSRILVSVICFMVFSIAGYFWVDQVLNWLAKPVGSFVFTSPTDALFIRLKIACGLGLFASFPIVLFQVWRFIEVALLPHEKSMALTLVPFSSALFFLGLSVAIFGVAPNAVRFLMTFGSEQLQPFISIQAYFSFLLWMLIGFGLLFQMPIVVLFLTGTGLVSASTLSQYRRHILVGLLILAAFLTPGPDIFSQLILTIPTYLLFELTVLLAKIKGKKKTG